MNDILAKIFKKRGIESVDKLTREEKDTLEMYERILSKKEMNLEDLKQFIIARIGQIEMKWQDTNTDAAKRAELIPYHTVYRTLLNAINAPQQEREALEKILLSQLDI